MSKLIKKYNFMHMTSVVDPDPVKSETFSRIQKKSFRIRAVPGPKWIWHKTTLATLINLQKLTISLQNVQFKIP